MATGVVGGNALYSGTVSHVTKNYGFIALDGQNPVPSAFFDKGSVGGNADDMRDLFSKGCKVRARIGLTDGAHKVNFKAFGLVLANQQLDSSLRGADNYLKKYLEDHGAQQVDDLIGVLRNTTDNCPRVLKNGTVDDIKRVSSCRPDLFEVKNCFLCLSVEEREIRALILSKMEKYKNKITFGQIQGVLSSDDRLDYLRTNGSWSDGVMDFVSRHADVLVCWDSSVWKKEYLLGDAELNRKFQKELKAVKYYSQFVKEDVDYTTVDSLSGHYHQAPDEIKNVTRPKRSEFSVFLERNKFFFELDSDGDVENCSNSRLTVIDDHWSKRPQRRELRQRRVPTSPVAPAPPVLNVFSGFARVAPIPSNTPTSSSDSGASYIGQKDMHPAMRMYVSRDNKGKGGKEYLKKYLPDTGAKRLLQLICELSAKNDPACPAFLKYFQELCNLAQDSPDMFSTRNGFFCLNAMEDTLVAQTYNYVKGRKLPMAELKNIFPADSQPGKYLFASAKNARDCIKEFLERNAKWFLVWDNCITSYDAVFGAQAISNGIKSSFEREMKAVKFYTHFVENDGTEIDSVRGHFAQATQDVRSAARSTEEEFAAFLKKNFFFIDVMGSKVKICHKDRLKVIDEYWLNSKTRNAALKSAPPQVPGIMSNPVQPTTSDPSQGQARASATSTAVPHQASSPAKPPISVSKAFSDAEAEMNPGKRSPFHDVSATISHAARLSLETSVPAEPSLYQSHGESSDASGSGGIYASPEARMFKKLIGGTIGRAIEDEVLSTSTLNSLLLLRMIVGKPPMAKFRIPDESGGLTQTLKTEPVKSEDLHRMLRHDEVVKMLSASHYGVKGTLHSIRTMEQAGAITGLTLFCQLHEAEAGLSLDIWKGRRLTAVFNANYPVKIIYNYLRCKCEKLARREDVLVIDVDGQLSGCDRHPHPSLGNVTRMQCSSSSELPQAIMDSIQHLHEFVVVIGVDATEHLKAIKKMCGKDIQVIAEISSDLRSEVESMFS